MKIKTNSQTNKHITHGYLWFHKTNHTTHKSNKTNKTQTNKNKKINSIVTSCAQGKKIKVKWKGNIIKQPFKKAKKKKNNKKTN